MFATSIDRICTVPSPSILRCDCTLREVHSDVGRRISQSILHLLLGVAAVRVSRIVLVFIGCSHVLANVCMLEFNQLEQGPLDRRRNLHFIMALAPALMAYRTMTPAAKNGIIGSAVRNVSCAGGLLNKSIAPILPGYFFGQKPGILIHS